MEGTSQMTIATHRWRCKLCNAYGTIEGETVGELIHKATAAHSGKCQPRMDLEIEPIIETFDARAWSEKFQPQPSGDKFTWFGAGLPVEIMDALQHTGDDTSYIFLSWSGAMEGLVRAANSAWNQGWRPK